MQAHHLVTRRKDKHVTEKLCRECHASLHSLFSNTALRDPKTGLEPLEGILANEAFQKALTYIRKIPPGQSMTIRQSKQAKRGH